MKLKLKAPQFKICVKIPKKEIKNEYIAIIVGILIFFSYAGVVYDMIRHPAPFAYQRPVYPSLGDQFVVEGYVAAILLMLMGIGLLFIYDAGKNMYSRNRMLRSTVIGVTLLFIGIVIIMWMLSIKVPNMFK